MVDDSLEHKIACNTSQKQAQQQKKKTNIKQKQQHPGAPVVSL